MKSKFVAQRYATALYETAAENGILSSVKMDMTTIRTIFGHMPGIRDYCLQSRGNRSSNMVLLETAFFPNIGKYTKAMLIIAIKNNRISLLPFLPDSFDKVWDKKNNTVAVIIETAHTYSDETISLLSQKISGRIGKKTRIETKVNPALLGGFRFLWENKILDQSITGRLNKIRHILMDQR